MWNPVGVSWMDLRWDLSCSELFTAQAHFQSLSSTTGLRDPPKNQCGLQGAQEENRKKWRFWIKVQQSENGSEKN